jgi:hypothetical protein
VPSLQLPRRSTTALARGGNSVSCICIDSGFEYGGNHEQFELNMQLVEADASHSRRHREWIFAMWNSPYNERARSIAACIMDLRGFSVSDRHLTS